MAMLLSRSTLAKCPVFHLKMSFSRSKCIHIGFFSSNSKSAPQNGTPVPNFCQIRLTIREARILTWNDTKNCLMTSYLPRSDDINKIIINFERFHSRVPYRAKFDENWTTSKGKTEPIFYQNTPA